MKKRSFLQRMLDKIKVEEYDDAHTTTDLPNDGTYVSDNSQLFGESISFNNRDNNETVNTHNNYHTNRFDDSRLDTDRQSQHSSFTLRDDQELSPNELAIDLFETSNEIVVLALIPGIDPANVDISATRESLTISGKRKEPKEVSEDDYHYRELYWGSFARTVQLPVEIETDNIRAQEKNSVFTIRLEKIDRNKKTRVKVKRTTSS
jgi:HSP20 family protein